jgi:putative FmdB family regulatory protein
LPIYEYECVSGHRTEAYRPIARRDERPECPDCHALARRALSRLQAPILRPLGYSLRPGEPGYWQFETERGRPAPTAIEPFAKLREGAAPQLAPDDLPVALVADAPRSPGPASPDARIKE